MGEVRGRLEEVSAARGDSERSEPGGRSLTDSPANLYQTSPRQQPVMVATIFSLGTCLILVYSSSWPSVVS